MKNVSKFVVFILVAIIIIVIGIIFFKQMKKNDGNKIASEGIETIEKYKALENLSEEESDLNLSSFIESKYYIVLLDNIVYHKDELDKFIKNVNSNISDKITIVQVTYGEEIIIKDVEFAKDKFIIKIDNRWGGDLSKENRKIVANEYDAKSYKLDKEKIIDKSNNSKTYYKINLVKNNNLSLIYIYVII